MAESEVPTVPTISKTQVAAPPQSMNIIDPRTAANLLSWLSAPLTIVGSNTASLEAYPSGMDLASRAGSKKQLYTSFSSLPFSYYAHIYISILPQLRSTGTMVQILQEERTTIPPMSEVNKLTADKRNAYQAGELVYTHMKGFMTREQYQRKKAATNTSHTPQRLRFDTVTSISPAATPPQTSGQNTSSPSAQSESAPRSGPELSSGDDSPGTSTASSLSELSVTVSVVPIRIATPTHLATIDMLEKTPYTNMYNSILASFQTDQGTAIRATIKNASIRDATTWSVLTNSLQNKSGSYMDIAPLTRIALVSHSICPNVGKFDPAPYKPIKHLNYTLESIHLSRNPRSVTPFTLIAMPIDTFTSFMTENAYWNAPPPPFLPSEVDRSWTAIPVKDATLSASYIREYITAFMASDLTYGKVSKKYNWTHDRKDLTGFSVSMPASNLAYLDGPKNAILVLVDRMAQICPRTVRVGDLVVDTFRGQTGPPPRPPPPDIRPADWSSHWNEYFSDRNMFSIRKNYFQAWTYMCNTLAVDSACGQALALAAEMTMAATPGLYIHPSRVDPTYDKERPLSGTFSISTHDDATVPLASQSPYNITNINLNSENASNEIKTRVTGVNLSALSALHAPPTGLAKKNITITILILSCYYAQ